MDREQGTEGCGQASKEKIGKRKLMRKGKFQCVKCQSNQYSTGETRVTGGFWSKIFDVQNRKFITVSCQKCGYTEFYEQVRGRSLENIFDFLSN